MTNLGLPLQGGMLQRVPPNAPRDIQIAVLNDIVDRLNAQQKTVTLSDTTTRRWMNGYQSGGFGDSDFGTKISRPGVDVVSATDEELVFLDDQQTRTYRDTEGNLVLKEGLLPNGMYGSLYYLNGTPHIIITPETGMVAAEEGDDVLNEV